jgi:hypothetical protein
MIKGMSKRMSTRKTCSPPARGKRLKQRKTFTLSPESIALLEELSARRKPGERESVSAVLDTVLAAVREEQQRLAIERSTQKHYDERSPEEEDDEIAWARFALSQFPVRDSSPGESR